jgi:hypothetical protein
MKSAKLASAIAAVFLASSLLAASAASAQMLDDVWFKLVVKVKGYSVDPATGDYDNYKLSQTVYLLFELTGGGPLPGTALDYDLTAYTETAPGVWTADLQDNESTISSNENFFPDVNFTLDGMGGSWVGLYHTPHIQIKDDGMGGLKKAKYKALGEVFEGEDSSGNEIYGDASIKGKTVDVSKLPFIP